MTFGERLADRLAAVIGSWRFILTQTILLVVWVLVNVLHIFVFDQYPFTFLNLILSVQAAFTGPILLLSANRIALQDRKRAMKNLIIDQQDHEIIMRMEAHVDNHIHDLRNDMRKFMAQ